jgi:nitroreductase
VPDDDIRTVVALAGLAPSVHNTQPWHFRWDGAALSLLEDTARALPVLDPSGRARVLSCGAALAHARLALRELGYDTRTTLLPEGAGPAVLARLDVVGRVDVAPAEHELAQAIPRRATDRDPFSSQSLPDEVVRRLRDDVEAEGAWLHVLDADEQVEVQVLLAHADAAQRADPAYVEELRTWRRDDSAVGVPSRALPTVLAEARGSSFALRDFDAGGTPPVEHVGRETPPVPEHPSAVVLGTAGDSRADWLAAGQAVARLLLHGAARASLPSP